jgi:molybdenum cofactor guanylyltransferase
MSGEVAVAILAGGGGRRIGGSKPLMVLGGKRLIDRAVEQADRYSDLVAVAVRDEAQVRPVGAVLISDDPDIQGPLGGLVAGLKFARYKGREFLLTIPADTPFLPSDLLARLAAAIGDWGCSLAKSGGQLHPMCGLWRSSSLERIQTYVTGGRRSLWGFAGMIGYVEVEWPVGPGDPFFNINEPADLAEAERRMPR